VLKFLLVVAAFAALVYAIMWALERRRAAKSAGGSSGGSTSRKIRRAPEVRQVAPDDDEDFLRWLERKRRKDSPES
jgi:hypothetical protein